VVVSHRSDGRLHVKASDVDRGLSLKAMTDKPGPFAAPGQHAEPPRTRYARPNRRGDLYEAFQRARDAAIRERDAAVARLTAQHRVYARELAAWYRQRLRQEHAQPLKGALRRDGFQHLADQREQDRVARMAREREERRQVRAAHPIPNWQGYLEAEAAKGNAAALASLRSRQRRTQRLKDALLTAQDAGQARHILHQHMQPAIRRDGRVIYRMTDGGVVSDEAAQIRVPQSTAAAAFLALSLAADRFGARPLVVQGTEEFRGHIARVAGIEGLAVSFADPALERQRIQSRAGVTKTVDPGRNREDDTHNLRRSEPEGDRGR
jgi:Large polyvalent protein-associated domain 7